MFLSTNSAINCGTNPCFQRRLIKTFLAMKLTIFLILIASLQVSANGYSQTVTLAAKDAPLESVFKSIKTQTGYGFFYDQDLMKFARPVTVNVREASLQSALDACFENQGLSYNIVGKIIVVKERAIPRVSNSSFEEMLLVSQYQLVSGKVSDENGNGLAGVSVLVKGTTTGTTTDALGNYSLNVVNIERAELEFTMVGYSSVIVHIKGRTVVNVTMGLKIEMQEEVMIVAYGKQTRASFTGAAVDVDMNKIKESPLSSFQESLQGNVAGLQMSTQSGQPGAAQDVRIRGIGSINASSDPLYVVDGIPIVTSSITNSNIAKSSNTIAGINPKDIADITVLKDASATAIYGSRGANGVILITTKQGQAGKTKFDFNAQKGVSQMLIRDMYRPLNTDQLSELMVESRVNAGSTRQQAEDYIFSRIDKTINTDWVDVVTRNAQYDDYNMSASGGSDKTQFFSSLGLHHQDGVVIGIGQKRLSGRLNLSHKATNRLKIDLGVSANKQTLNTNSDAGAAANPVRTMLREVPWEPVYNSDGSYNTSILLTYNPVGMVKENIRESNIYGILGNIGLTFDIAKNLSFQTKGNLDFNFVDEFKYDNPYFGAARNSGGEGRQYKRNLTNYNITNLLKYSKGFNVDHHLNVTLGQEAQKIQSGSVYAYASNYAHPKLTTLANASVYQNATSSRTASAISSYFINANYSFQNKYYFNVTGRRDGSSRFGSAVRFANFGSIGAAWNVAAEDFMNPAGVLKELKLRASYGVNGNQEIGNFASLGLYKTGADYDGEPGYIYDQQSNPNLTWEKNEPFNIGLDFNFNHRLTGTIEYYTRTTSSLLFRVPMSATNGLNDYLANVGEMKNSGMEISLNSVNIDNSSGLRWVTNFNLTTNKNRITKLEGDESIIDGMFIRELGGDFYTFYMPGYAGADPANGDALWYKDANKTTTTNKYSEAEYAKQGSALPKFFAGMYNSFTYRNFGLSFLLYLNYGNKVYNYWGRYTHSDGSAQLNDRGNMAMEIYQRRWQKPGDVTYIPKVVWNNKQSGLSTQQSTRFLYDGTYLRLRDITLSYNFPKSLLNPIGFNNIRFYLKGTNAFSWIKDKRIDMDPEVGIDGQSDLRMPISRQILVGLDLSF